MRDLRPHPNMDAIQAAVARAHGVALQEWLRSPDFFEIELDPDGVQDLEEVRE